MRGAGVMGRAFEEYVARHRTLDGVDDFVKCISGMTATGLPVKARAISIDRTGIDTTRWKWEGINSYKEFTLRANWLSFEASCESPEELMRGSWLVRDYTGNGELQALTAGAFTTGWLSVGADAAVDLLTAALQRPGHNGTPGISRLELLPKLIGVGGLITESSRFGDKGNAAYTSAVFVLKHLLTHGYTAAERKAAAVGAQTTPHTLAAAIVQVEARRRLAATPAHPGMRVDTGAARAAAGTSTAASRASAAAAAPTGGTVAVEGAVAPPPRSATLVPQALPGRATPGLSDDALARVRAAADLAAEGASVDEVVRAALRSALGGDAPHHPDALPPRAALPALEYGDGL